MKNYVQDGDYITITAGADVDSGELVQFGSLHGVAVTDIANGAQGVLALKGVFTLPKLTAASADACTAGGPVYFAAGGSVSGSNSSGTRKQVGYALAAANQAAPTVVVRLG